MIGSLNGILKESGLTEILVEINGVGYELSIPMSTYDRLPKVGEKVFLHTYMHVREDAIQLYGFATPDEKKLYMLLMSVSGIGPRLALNVLSSMTVPSFCSAISAGDTKMLSKISGVGKKTGERMVLELKGKIKTVAPETAFTSKVPEASAKAAEDAVLALVQLGFKYEVASRAVHELVRGLPEKECNSGNIIRLALAKLNG